MWCTSIPPQRQQPRKKENGEPGRRVSRVGGGRGNEPSWAEASSGEADCTCCLSHGHSLCPRHLPATKHLLHGSLGACEPGYGSCPTEPGKPHGQDRQSFGQSPSPLRIWPAALKSESLRSGRVVLIRSSGNREHGAGSILSAGGARADPFRAISGWLAGHFCMVDVFVSTLRARNRFVPVRNRVCTVYLCLLFLLHHDTGPV